MKNPDPNQASSRPLAPGASHHCLGGRSVAYILRAVWSLQSTRAQMSGSQIITESRLIAVLAEQMHFCCFCVNCLSHEAALRCRTETWMLARRIGWFFNHPQEAGWPAICFFWGDLQGCFGFRGIMATSYRCTTRIPVICHWFSVIPHLFPEQFAKKVSTIVGLTVFAVETASDLIQLWEPSPYCLGRRVAAPGGWWYHVMFFLRFLWARAVDTKLLLWNCLRVTFGSHLWVGGIPETL